MLRAVNRAFNLADKVAVMGFESFTYNALALKDFFDKPVLVETIADLDDLAERQRQLMSPFPTAKLKMVLGTQQ